MAVQADYNSLAQQVYISYFGRPADSLGLSDMTAQLLAANVPVTGIAAGDTTAFVNAYSTNATIKSIIDNFGTSTESLSYFGAGSDASFVNAIYLQVLGRAPLLEGLTFWSNALANAQMTRGEAALRIMEGALNNTTAQGLVDAAGIANKTIAASTFTANQLTTTDVLGYSGSAAAATARAWLATVTDDAATLTAATSSVTTTITGINDATAATAAVGTTFALTSAADNITGTAVNDTINGVLQFTSGGDVDATTTITAGDQIAAGAGTDTLNISVSGADISGAGVGTITPSMTGVEKVLVSNANLDPNGRGVTVNLSLADTALTTVGTTASTTDAKLVTFASVGKLTGVEMAGKGDLTVNYITAATTGIADSLTVNANGVGTSAAADAKFTTAGIETLNVVSGVTDNYLTLSADTNLTTINVSGAKNITLNALGATNTAITDISAATATGDVSIDASGLVLADITVTGGTGTNDTFTTDSAAITASSKLAAVTGFETLAASGAGVTVTLDAAVTGLTTVNLGDTGTQTLTLATGFTGALTVDETDNAGAADTINNTAGATLTVNGAEADITGITIAGHATAVDTLNITAGAGSTSLVNVTSVDAINVLANATTASTAAAITNAKVATGKTMTVNASALTNSSATFGFSGAASQAGAVNVTGATTAVNTIDLTNFAGNNTVTGGSGKDVITGGTGDDSISTGAGNDTIVMGANLTADDTIDGGTGTNTLSITSFTDAAIFANVTNVQALKLTGNTSVFAPVSVVSTFDLSDTSAQVLTLATGYTGDTTVTLTGNGATSDSVINSANVALTVNGNVLDLDGTVITGGTGTDILNITADTNTGSLVNVTGVETINVLQHATTATNDAVLTNIAAATGKTVTIDASGMTNASANFGLNTVSGAGSFVVTAATAGGAIDLSGASGAATVTGGAGGDTITLTSGINSISAGAGTDAIIAGTTLLNTDVIDGGTGTDTLTATIAGTSATTGAFNIANVETVTLTSTAASTVDATTITGATLLAFANGTGGIKVTGLAAAATVGLGTGATAFTGASNFALTDATGTADVLNIKLNTTAVQTTGVITTANIETLNITQNAIAAATQTLNLTGSTAATINVTGSSTNLNTRTLDLGTLNAAAATVDASAIAATGSTFIVTGANTGAMTFKGSAGANQITGGGGNDTITIASGFDGSDVVAGGNGTDTLNATIDSDSAALTSLAGVTAVETLNLTVASTAAASTITTVGALDGTALKSFTLTGINPTTAFTVSTNAVGSAGTNLLTSFDASGYAGVVDVLFDGANTTDNIFATGNTIKGGSGSSDVARVSLGGVQLTKATMSGFETFVMTSTDDTASLDLTNTTGVTTLTMAGANSLAVTGLAVGAAVNLGTVGGASVQTGKIYSVGLSAATGTADAMTVNVNSVNTAGAALTVAADGIENLTVKYAAGVATSLTVTQATNTNAQTLTLTSTETGNNQTLTTIPALVSTIAATGLADNLIMTTGRSTSAMTVNSGSGSDTLVMVNKNDVMNAGSGTLDILQINTAGTVAGYAIDLSSTVDQVTLFNGSTNAAVQIGFEGVNLSNITGTFGSDITAASTGSTITGTSNADVITGGAGNDTIVGGTGNDAITGGSGNDVFSYTTAALFEARSTGANNTSTFDGGANTDTLAVMEASTGGIDADLAGLTSVEQLSLTGASSIVLGANAAAAGLTTVITGTGNTSVTVTPAANIAVVATLLADNSTLTLVDTDTTNFTVTGLSANLVTTAVAGTLNVTTAAVTATTIETSAAATTIGGLAVGATVDATDLADNVLLSLSGATNYTVTNLTGNVTFADTAAGNQSVTVVATTATTVAFGTNTTGTHAVTETSLSDTVALTLTGSDAASVGLILGDLAASTYAGNLTVTATTGTNVITTGLGNDTITGGLGADSIVGGIGADSIIGGAADRISVSAGDSGLGTITTTEISTTAMDKITVAATTILDLAGAVGDQTLYDNLTEVAAGVAITTVLTTNQVGQFVGVWDSEREVFTSSATNAAATDADDEDALLFTYAVADGTNTVATQGVIVLGVGAQTDDDIENGIITFASGIGGTFDLTTFGDNKVGGSGDDTFRGTHNQNTPALGTFSHDSDAVLDTIVGGGGIDTLEITPIVNVALLTAATFPDSIFTHISGIEKIVIKNTGTGVQTIVTDTNFIAAFTGGVIDLKATSTTGAQHISGAGLTTLESISDASIVGNIFSGDNLANVTVTSTTGSQHITTGANVVATVNMTTDDTAAVANEITTGTLNDTIIIHNGAGGANSTTGNTITGGTGADNITLGTDASKDTMVFATGASGQTLETADTITNFTTAVDKIKSGLNGAAEATIADGALNNFAAFVVAADALFAAGAGANNGIYVAYNADNSGNAWVAIDHNDSGTLNAGDTLIILTGINLIGEIALGDFIA